MKNIIMECRCPYCGSDNLEWGAFDYDDDGDGAYYEVQCSDCRQYFDEWYDLKFSGVRDHHGKYMSAGEVYESEEEN